MRLRKSGWIERERLSSSYDGTWCWGIGLQENRLQTIAEIVSLSSRKRVYSRNVLQSRLSSSLRAYGESDILLLLCVSQLPDSGCTLYLRNHHHRIYHLRTTLHNEGKAEEFERKVFIGQK
jgi:hypothetical protein